MLQRIQTLYLVAVLVVMGVLPLFIPIWKSGVNDVFLAGNQLYAILGALIVGLTVLTIFYYQKRQLQFVFCRLNMILNLILLGLFVYRSLNLSGETPVSEKGIGMFLPIIAIVFLVLANKAIKKDEDLVKSVDRLR